MIIPLNHPDPTQAKKPPLPPQLVKLTGSEDILLVELQGSLVTTGESAGQRVGILAIDPSSNKPTLRIGNHLLEGTIQNLSKPLGVIVKSASSGDGPGLRIPRVRARADEMDSSTTSYDIVAVVKKKIVFSKRPIPIVPSHLRGIGSVSVNASTAGGGGEE
ncbi:hypothetical protein DL93DRAFT_2059925 [Clavulina sp. PMI_390]|nr:hypothetical protein DL93DRAFT_2059925 [Clavulina sp. PMI_390]